MKNRTPIIIFIISLLLSITLYFNVVSIQDLIKKSLIATIFLSGTGLLFFLSYRKHKKKDYKKTILYSALAIVSLILSILVIMGMFQTIGYTVIQPAHYRQSIFTGTCEFGGYSGFIPSEPWYYKPCDLTEEEKINAIEDMEWFPRVSKECKELYCLGKDEVSFEAKIYCNEILALDLIECK